MSAPIQPIMLRYRSVVGPISHYGFMMGDVLIAKVYVNNNTQSIELSRPDSDVPTHMVPMQAVMTDEPDTSERGDRTGLRVKQTALVGVLAPISQLILIALLAGRSIGPVLALNEMPTITDDALMEFLQGE